jgi:hypothetical protein
MKTTAKVVEPVVHGTIPTIIEFLLDETGSMSRFLNQTIAGFKDFIDEQRSQDGLCLLTLTKFDTRGMRNPYTDLDIGMVPYLTTETFVPNASTNLRDTIIARIDDRMTALTHWDIKPRVLFVCMTDGEDNASQHNVAHTRERISKASQEDWTFVFLGAYEKADRAAIDLGFQPRNIRSFEGAKMQETMQELARATKAYRAATSTPTDFYASV